MLGSILINIERKLYVGVGQPKRQTVVDIYFFFFSVVHL